MVKVLRDDVVALCEVLGYKTAGSWNKDRMLRKLKDVAELAADGGADDKVTDEGQKSLLDKIVAAGGVVEVVQVMPEEEPGDDEPEEEEGQDEVNEQEEIEPEQEGEADEPEEEPEEESEVVEDEQPAKPAKVKPVKAKPVKVKPAKVKPVKAKPVKAKGKYLADFPGIHSIRNRLFCAGEVIRKHGLKAGCTDAMVKELDKLSGKPNMVASKSQLTLAWHSINGYVSR